MKMALLDAVANAGADLIAAAATMGGQINFDARLALSRNRMFTGVGSTSANGTCRLIQTRSNWIAVNLARPDDVLAVPAWIDCGPNQEPWQAIELAAGQTTAAELLERAIDLHLPVSVVGESVLNDEGTLRIAHPRRRRPLVVDLSALWAGPYAGGLLAQAGCEVWKVESRTRRDPTRISTPEFDRRLNGQKCLAVLDFDGPSLAHLVATADVLITSARPRALANLGITVDRLLDRNPNLLWLSITAHGWDGDLGLRVGFGDDCAVAGGLVTWSYGQPSFLGDALADPLTGIYGATAVLRALGQGRAGMIKVSLAGVARQFAKQL